MCFEAGVELTTADQAEAIVIGTLSPGPMLDAVGRWTARGHRVVAPWLDARAAPTRAQERPTPLPYPRAA